MKISIIIPIFNAEEFIDKLLLSIEKQSLTNDKFEVIFVNNNSTDNTSKILGEFCKKNNINTKKLFFDKKQSSYASRNFGVEKSSGDLLAFTDADCILDKDWLKNIYDFYYSNKKDIIVSGQIDLIINNRKNIWELYDKEVFLNNKKYFKANKSAATANLITSKTNFYEIGFFDEVVSSGDKAWTLKAKKLKKQIEFVDDIKVYHPSRKTYNEIKKKTKRIAFGKGQLKAKNKRNIFWENFKNLLRIFYLRTNLKYSIFFIKNTNVELLEVLKFNFYFLKLRIIHLIGFYEGFVTTKGDD